ncbi:hypothetical protein GTO87_05930 [Ligilactobacillus saerimneri]|uniref:Uncharacterized protein n=1 Tax=Ligilactobacillus saerimneri TaxID=228229 RepID=A0A7H9ELC3_9LACO|nr:hypothetical protein [Ligilactobacillus saerimneri]QLL78179.1 hypothetical protein GTO87_05930 [Ligilactobacillus saerimneri]
MKLNNELANRIKDDFNSLAPGTKGAFSYPEFNQHEVESLLNELHIKFPTIFSKPDTYYDQAVNVIITHPKNR